MSEIKTCVYFSYTGKQISIQFKTNEAMASICQRFSNKIPIKMNSILFIYEEKQVNFESKFREQVNEKDLDKNTMNILVLKKEEFLCPKCKGKDKLNSPKLDEIIKSNNETIKSINIIKINIDNIIDLNKANPINSQLKLINKMLNTINKDIKNNGENKKNF